MKTSSLRFCCVLIFCFLAQLVDCEANVDEGKACSEQHRASENLACEQAFGRVGN